jgi:hypothetical protein
MTVFSMPLLVFVSLVASMPVAGQDFTSFTAKARCIVEAKDSKLKLVLRDERGRDASYIWNFELGPEVPGIRLYIFQGASKQEAAERMHSVIDFLPVGPRRAPEGPGDEAYISKGLRAAKVWFRKSNVYVDVSAPSVEMAEDIAKKIADLVPGK